MRILVIGASRGIGRQIAADLSSKHHVIGAARTSVDIENVARLQMDVLRETRWNLGYDYLDAIIICAGSQAPIGPTMSMPRAAWWEGVQNNLYGTFNAIHGCFPYLKRHCASRAKIICFSGGGATSARPNLSAYACAKTAIVRLVETLSAEWAISKESVDINAIAPGALSTEMTREIMAAPPDLLEGTREKADAEGTLATSDLQQAQRMRKVCTLVEWLLATQVSGKLFSAPWDDWSHAHATGALASADNFVLRRVAEHSK